MKSSPLLKLFVLLLIMSSCVTQKKVEYLQDPDKSIKKFAAPEFLDYKLKPNDELFIQISSLDNTSANFFENSSQQSSLGMGSMQPYGASLLSYAIDKEGILRLPLIGSIYVKDKTTSQVSSILKDSLTHILNQPVVSVKLVNRYITVLGEVRAPGHYSYAQDKLSIYEAIGLAGDILDYGNRNQVILIRNENGTNLRINIDLTKSTIIASDYYYLRPSDIVYVKPLRKRFWGMREFPFAVMFSAITTGLLLYNTKF